jgi:hypothetical protein
MLGGQVGRTGIFRSRRRGTLNLRLFSSHSHQATVVSTLNLSNRNDRPDNC